MTEQMQKVQTYIEGFDFITKGGLPEGRTTLVCGKAGCGKSVLAAQFLAEGILKGNENGVFVTFEETPADVRKNMIGLGFDIEKWENEGRWTFVDASPQLKEETTEIGKYDMGGLLSRIEFAIKKVNAKRLAIDSLSVIFSRFHIKSIIRRECSRLIALLRDISITTILTAERVDDYGDLTRHGMEEFVVDNVIVLRNILEEQTRRRTIEVIKFRGTDHQKGQWPFTIIPDTGLLILPLSAIELAQHVSDVRVTTGNQELDTMTGGGFYQDSAVLISGATGTGKTLVATSFMATGCREGRKALFLAFEESEQQIKRNAMSWGIDLESFEESGLLKILSVYPESATLEEHLARIKTITEEFQPDIMVVDSLSAINRVASERMFTEFAIALTCHIKAKGITGLMTAVTPSLYGGDSVTNIHISTITDAIIVLSYVQLSGKMCRGIMVLKMRGSNHEKSILEYTIDGQGLHIGQPFEDTRSLQSNTNTGVDQIGVLLDEPAR